jgi:hypothetical protein
MMGGMIMCKGLKSKLMLMMAAFAMLFSAQSTMAVERVGDPYTLGTCAVSGKDAWAKGDPLVIIHEGREVKTCCKNCKSKFEADPAKFLPGIDAKIIAQQDKHYPLTTCVVGGGALDSKGEPVVLVVNNRLVKLCCNGCKKKVKANPAGFIAKLDEAAIAKQNDSYNLKKCPIGGEDLGDKAKNIVLGNRLVKLCCAGCKKKVNANPAKVFAMLDTGKVNVEGSGKKK